MRRFSIVLVVAFACAAVFTAQGRPSRKQQADAKAATRHRATAQAVNRALAEHHLTRRAPDDVISRRAWTNLVESCDADHMVFLASDIAEFEKSILKLDDAFRKGDFSFAYKLRDVYRKRLRDRVEFATNELAHAEFEFKGGNFLYKRDGEPWPATVAERDAMWRLRLKGEVLDEFLGCETGGVKRAAAALVKSYLDELSAEMKRRPDDACEDFIAAIASAYDAHTLYLTKAEYKAFKTGMNLSMCGVGVEWTLKDGGIKVKRVLPGGPIAKDGRIKPGDVITGVAPKGDGKIKKTDGLSTREVVALFAGKKGQKITLEVKHSDGRVARYTIVRDEVPMDDEAASSSVIEIDVAGKRLKAGYLRLPSFYAATASKEAKGRSCAEDLRVELEKLKKAGVCGVLFDLRGNNGGSLDDAVKVIGLFVRSGPAVRMRGTGGDITLPVPADSTICEVPVLVLTSRASASAGELVPATLQDLGRAVVAGDAQTFGKGTAQTVSEFNNGGECAAVVTDGRFYRVTGASTQFKGVESDILLPSVFDDEYYKGERGLKYPLPWDEIESSNFSPSWDLKKFIPELRRASEERLAKNPAWKKHLEKVKWAEEKASRKTVPLNVAARKEQIKRDNAVDDAMEHHEDKGYNPADRASDVVLDEGFRILADLVRLNGGRVLPKAKTSAASETLLGGLNDDD
ncbi:MAG: carboxy terminal-processing peptidase [Kiritimatiellae bacterium]|nr:carboxy terminal-processing peptidase [Kiritimatiellia bacterium]